MTLSTKNILIVTKKTNGHCFYCNTSKAYEVDHFFPNKLHRLWGLKSHTNNNSLENLFLCCSSCNKSKGAKHLEDFLGVNYIAWSKFMRANFRVGLVATKQYTI